MAQHMSLKGVREERAGLALVVEPEYMNEVALSRMREVELCVWLDIDSFNITTSSSSLLHTGQGKSILGGVVVQKISTYQGNMGMANGLGGCQVGQEGCKLLC